MIWALLASAIAIAVGASGKGSSLLRVWIDEWRKSLRKHVRDRERRAAGLAIVDKEAEWLDTYFASVSVTLRSLYDVHRDYDSTLEQYEPLIDEAVSAFAEVQRRHVDATYEMRSTLEPDEWQAIEDEIGERLESYWTKQRKQDAKKSRRR